MFYQIREDFKNRKTKQVRFNTKPEIITSDYYQSIERDKKSHKVKFTN